MKENIKECVIVALAVGIILLLIADLIAVVDIARELHGIKSELHTCNEMTQW